MWLILRLGGLGCIFRLKTRQKRGSEGLDMENTVSGTKTVSFWSLYGQNEVVLTFFFLIQNTNQNGVILVCLGPKRRRFGPRQT